ncbi:PEP-CTERM-box response regulator transcription factor [Colwellia sp. 4_MG-2023]|jgi:two-component system NtrC family response regulator|uniref:PEP-CTERM-box response regulator transcription factor n=1 Tax=unclassified Colwellia TaxID=196834 RepID=UPI001C08A69C|nr:MULTISPECIES: PEP-CTERM-box response regulator transcription factor [unclassified Colwellia]MBU2924954.1 PEP-CTERM-box response regulator transcription factor [Colwellia sp. C2M11]MDO6487726.1 PEP-CTERM-box response regulator transcription factor [Colwellia sp. 6_MG-2023]MDO6506853.1 PEP-CTERM-box response regulator transcription factor [Colwellia sp. 5_MG-2023]MDO6555772.1 PEP-CTERM-box response regulator transcription factor [Colwellia sp. 4_MG-2023]MDO6652813.1 PEP-CTERM-box response reg
MEKVLIVDDDKGIQKQLKWSLSDYSPILAGDRESAIAAVRRHEPKVVTLDLGLPPDETNASEGLKALEEILAIAPHTKVIVITGNEDRVNALEAIAAGAYDFYQKPIDAEVINVIISRAFTLANIESENRSMRAVTDSNIGIIGNSEAIDRLCTMVKRIAPTNITALLLGESGTGKEVTAKAVHLASDRADKPFIAINCASIPETLLESELFGFEKGAFTGAHKTTKGKIECAEGGTLFLDEIGDMPFNLQAKLLRFLQEKIIERLGGREEIPVNVRVVCATNQNLEEMVANKEFREDLFYRVSEITLNIPPLRDRDEDVLILAKYFLQLYATEYKRNAKSFSEDAIGAINTHKWPGNIRELQNKVKSAVVMSTGVQVTAFDLGFFDHSDTNYELSLNLRTVREQAESLAIQKAYALSEGNMSKTSELLGVTRPTLYSLIEKYELSINS